MLEMEKALIIPLPFLVGYVKEIRHLEVSNNRMLMIC